MKRSWSVFAVNVPPIEFVRRFPPRLLPKPQEPDERRPIGIASAAWRLFASCDLPSIGAWVKLRPSLKCRQNPGSVFFLYYWVFLWYYPGWVFFLYFGASNGY